jgi:uncharacterized protein YbjT (DUF2867 family)
MTETVLVVGGTGQLGAPVVRQLRRRSALAACAVVHLSVRGGPTAESYDQRRS